MRIAEMNWMQVETYLRRDDRCAFPIGSTEQHAQLSLCVDTILAERVAAEAAAPLGIPVLPVMPFGLSPYFSAYPGTITLRTETLLAVFRDVIASLAHAGFRRIVVVNGHGGNAPVGALAQELMADRPGLAIKLHNWWAAPRTMAKALAIDRLASHASWMENFPWTRVADGKAPAGRKPMVDLQLLKLCAPDEARRLLGDGNYGGEWEKSDSLMEELWQVGVAETREVLEGPWPNRS
ncbi:MAG: creatininase family protein [Alphaproteobacteria bacterium]|nr:creatininase family protein [Alphaproteobacteria bacterium]